MAGQGPAPKTHRRRGNAPARGEWRAVSSTGWQHGRPPPPPPGCTPATILAWETWMASWFAAMWVPEDLPGLHIVAHLYDAVVRGDHTRSSELRLWLDSYGITPKGQADRRWLRDDPAATPKQTVAPSDEAGPYAGLHLVDRGDAS